MRLADAATVARVPVCWRAMLLGPIFQAQGWNDSPFNVYPVKGHYMWHDMQRLCRELDLPYARPSVFPRNGLLAARVACACDDEPRLGSFVRAVFTANFVRDENISDNGVVAGCLEEAGIEPSGPLARAQSPAIKLKLRERTAAAAQAGIFGAPTFRVNGELYWGNERMPAAIAAACSVGA
jgi:2-hydroxychromene-2-carboxylate isomerase